MAIGALEPAAVPSARTPRPRVAVVIFALVVLAIPTAFIFPSTELPLGVLGVLIGHATAGILFVRGARTLGGKEARAWRFVGFGFMTTSSGVLIVAILNSIVEQVPAFGPQDIVFLFGYGMTFAGLALLPHTTGNVTARLRVWLDGLIGAVSLGSIMWVAYLGNLVEDAVAQSSLWERIAGFGYPVLDAMGLIVLMIVAVRRSAYRFDYRLLVFAGALTAQAFADLTFLSGLGEDWDNATPEFGIFLVAVAGFLGTALLVTSRPKPREYADRATALMPMIAPYAAAVVLIGLLFFRIVGSSLDARTIELLVATLLVGFLVVGRQSVAIRENRQLVEKERASLVSSISHELRTPLTAMMGFLELLDDEAAGVDEAERAELTTIVHHQAVYMSRIVADLIMLARESASEINLAEEPLRLRSVIDSAIKTVSEAAGTTDVSCPSEMVVYADADRLQQVLVNLLANAVRYGGDYRAIVARVERDGVVMEVHDNGPGVPPRHSLKIWERFERGPNRYNATNPGSGIGLAVVEAVAKAHGGEAEYERSTLLGGACFRVRLPSQRLVSAELTPTVLRDDAEGTNAA